MKFPILRQAQIEACCRSNTSADVKTKVHLVLVVPNAIIVALDVRIEQFVRRLGIRLILRPTRQHLLRTEV